MLLNKTECKCGKDYRTTKFDRYEPNFNKSFYGGRVDMYGYTKCECGRDIKGYFTRNIDQSLNLIDIEVIKDIGEDKKTVLEPTSCVYTEPSTEYIGKMYEEMTYKELKKIAKEKGIKGNYKQEKLIELLKAANR